MDECNGYFKKYGIFSYVGVWLPNAYIQSDLSQTFNLDKYLSTRLLQELDDILVISRISD